MKHTLIYLFSLFNIGLGFGQSFEGKLIYEVDFEIEEEKLKIMGISKEDILNKKKADGEFFDEITIYLKAGNYLKKDNSTLRNKYIYKSGENKIYFFQEQSEYVTIVNAINPNALNLEIDALPMQISKEDSIKIIHGESCKLVKLNWEGLGEE